MYPPTFYASDFNSSCEETCCKDWFVPVNPFDVIPVLGLMNIGKKQYFLVVSSINPAGVKVEIRNLNCPLGQLQPL